MVITNIKYLERNGKLILKHAKFNSLELNPSYDLNYYLKNSFEKYSEDYDNYPNKLEKPNRLIWQNYFKRRF